MNRPARISQPWVLLGEHIRVVVQPERGGRIASIVHSPSRREWLSQPAHICDSPAYGSSFTTGDMAGWDEMLPTIDSCTHPGPGVAMGARLPDHGEVWALPWEVVASDTPSELTMRVEGRALPYTLTRTLRITEPASLTIDYQLEVTGIEPLSLLWACHPQFDCPAGTRIVLPSSVATMLDVTDGPPGRRVAWPSEGPDGVDRLPAGAGRKLVAPRDLRVGQAELRDPEGTWLGLSWDPADLPYLGLWLDNCSLARQPVAVIEPTDGFFDSLEFAVSTGRAAITKPGSPRRWTVQVELGGTSRPVSR